jgi:hypothetical protein
VVDRVSDDVLESRAVLLLALDHFRPVAPAEEVVDAPVALVEGAGVAAVQVAHALVEVRLGRLEQEVVVVPHQAADVHQPAVAALDPAQNVEEDDPVVVVVHDRRVVVPAGHDVVGRAGEEDAVRSAHEATVAAVAAFSRPARVSAHVRRGRVTCQARGRSRGGKPGRDLSVSG